MALSMQLCRLLRLQVELKSGEGEALSRLGLHSRQCRHTNNSKQTPQAFHFDLLRIAEFQLVGCSDMRRPQHIPLGVPFAPSLTLLNFENFILESNFQHMSNSSSVASVFLQNIRRNYQEQHYLLFTRT